MTRPPGGRRSVIQGAVPSLRSGQALPAGALRVMQGEAVRLTLPWPPTTNNLYATVNGHRVKSARGRAYADAVGVLVGQQARPWTLTPPYRLTITLHAPARTGRYDISNREKALCDSIFAAIEQDDSLIDDLRLVRGAVDRVNPRAEVLVEELS